MRLSFMLLSRLHDRTQLFALSFLCSLLELRLNIIKCLGCEASELKSARELLDCIKRNVRVLLETGNVTDIFRLKGFFLRCELY